MERRSDGAKCVCKYGKQQQTTTTNNKRYTTNSKQQTTNNTRPFPPIVLISCVFLRHLARRPQAVDMVNVERAGGAQRRRGRRLRAALRHERQSIAMALAKKLHHTSRGKKIAGAREEENETNFAMGQRTPPPQSCSRRVIHHDA